MTRPFALVGTGPSLSDLVRPQDLVKNRYVCAIQGAIKTVPDAHEWIMYDPTTLRIYSQEASAFKGLMVKSISCEGPGYYPFQISFRHLSGSLCFALLYIATRAKYVELYGVDLGVAVEGYPGREGCRPALRRTVDFLNTIEIVNCCPSSQLDWFSKQERPWTKK